MMLCMYINKKNCDTGYTLYSFYFMLNRSNKEMFNSKLIQVHSVESNYMYVKHVGQDALKPLINNVMLNSKFLNKEIL